MTASSLQPPEFLDPVTGMAFVLVPGGRFVMGDQFGDGFPDERPTVEVELGDFWLGRTPVTQSEWRLVMDGNPSMFKKGGRLPVEMVSWDAAQAFIARLRARTGEAYRLPTEAEWEYAARSGGRDEKWAGTSNPEALADYCWFDANADGRTHPVGQKRPNGLGLYDMSGHTHEWNEECYVPDYLARLAAAGDAGRTGTLPVDSPFRSFRGGSWKRHPQGVRCTRRMGGQPHLGFGTFGLRLARSA